MVFTTAVFNAQGMQVASSNMIEEGMVPAAWVRFQLSSVTSCGESFDCFASSLDIDPNADWYTPTETKNLILNLATRLDDENYGHCRQPIPTGTMDLTLRIMVTGETLSEAIELLISFLKRLCPTRVLRKIEKDKTFIIQLETDGHDEEHAAACEITIILLYVYMMWSFVGEFIQVNKFYTRSKLYSSLMKYNKDTDSEVVFSEFTGLEFDKSVLSMPRRASDTFDPVNNILRWGLLVDKLRPIMRRSHLPLMNADGLLNSAETKARKRNVDGRQRRRIAIQETEYSVRDLEKSIKAAKAMVLIATTNKSISEIGFDLEFSDERSFRRFFSNTTGCTPLEYRRVYQEAAASEGRNQFRAILEAARAHRA
jgi:AraC-like DNA-binding protein